VCLGGVGSLSLKKLRMGGCEALEDVPPGLSNMCALEELDFSLCRS
jgi:hypothetical protein